MRPQSPLDSRVRNRPPRRIDKRRLGQRPILNDEALLLLRQTLRSARSRLGLERLLLHPRVPRVADGVARYAEAVGYPALGFSRGDERADGDAEGGGELLVFFAVGG